MNLKEVLGALKTLGKVQSLPGSDASNHIPGIPHLSIDRIGAIERRILEDLDPDPDINIDTVSDDEIERFLTDPQGYSAPGSASRPDTKGADGGLARRAIFRPLLVWATVVTLGLSTLAAVSFRADPSSVLYPIRLQREAISIAVAGSPLDKAERHIEFAGDRIRLFSQDLAAIEVVTIASESELHLTRAFAALKSSVPSARRTGVLGDLLGVSRSFERNLRLFSDLTAPYGTIVDQSIQRTAAMQTSIRSMLFGSKLVSLAPTDPALSAFQDRGGRRSRAKGPSQTPSADATTSSQSAAKPKDETPAVGNCSVAQGSVCITVPNPGALPIPW